VENKKTNFILINKSKPEDFYFELNNRIIPFVKEDENYYYVDIRGDINRIKKEDASQLVEIELDLDDDTINAIDKIAKEKGLSIDEMFNIIIKKELEEYENKNTKNS
jgi:hypothetical protein